MFHFISSQSNKNLQNKAKFALLEFFIIILNASISSIVAKFNNHIKCFFKFSSLNLSNISLKLLIIINLIESIHVF